MINLETIWSACECEQSEKTHKLQGVCLMCFRERLGLVVRELKARRELSNDLRKFLDQYDNQ